MALLSDIRNIYENQPFFIAVYTEKSKIKPKKVKIDVDLNVWDAVKGTCIINGMKDSWFLHGLDEKEVMAEYKAFIKTLYGDEISDKEIDVIVKTEKAKKVL